MPGVSRHPRRNLASARAEPGRLAQPGRAGDGSRAGEPQATRLVTRVPGGILLWVGEDNVMQGLC